MTPDQAREALREMLDDKPFLSSRLVEAIETLIDMDRAAGQCEACGRVSVKTLEA